jgi:stage IV sporulation protein FB
MENPGEQELNSLPAESVPAEEAIVYPPKFQKDEEASSNVWLRSFVSLALYLVLGYYIFHSFTMLLIITGIVVFHELGHFFAMKLFRYKDLGIFFIPLLGAYVSGSKREVSQKESAIILLAGPLPGIIAGIICYLLWQNNQDLSLGGIPLDRIALLFMLLNLINLLPVYPLDGGQLLNRVFLDEEGWISKIFVILSAALLIWVAWSLYKSSGQVFYFVLFLFPLMMLMRLQTDSKYKPIEKRIEKEGINADIAYEELPDKDYWHIRRILTEEHPSFKEVNPDPAAGYDAKEERIMTTVQSLLHRHLIQDVSLVGKILILLICAAAFASPWLLNMDLSFFRQFGF